MNDNCIIQFSTSVVSKYTTNQGKHVNAMNFLADGVTVMLVSIEEFADFVIRHFTLEKVLKTGVEKRSLTQYQFLSWPDHGMKTMKLGLIDQVATSEPRNLCLAI